MDLKNHFFLTFTALFLLGLIISRPGNAFLSKQEERDCRMIRGRLDCMESRSEYKMNDSVKNIHYHYEEVH